MLSKLLGKYEIYEGKLNFSVDTDELDFIEQRDFIQQIEKELSPIVVKEMESIGFQVFKQVDTGLRQGSYYGVKGGLHFDLCFGYFDAMEIVFYQSVNNPSRPDHKGRYERFNLMPFMFGLEIKRAMNRVVKLMNSVGDFQKNIPSYHNDKVGLKGVDAYTFVENKVSEYKRVHGEYKPEHYNNTSKDGLVLEHNAVVWFYDRKGRVNKGIAIPNINSMWWVITGKYNVTNKGSHELSIAPLDPRKKNNNYDRKVLLNRKLFNLRMSGSDVYADKIEALIRREFNRPEYLLDRKQADAYFKNKGLEFTDITKDCITRLRRLLNKHMRISGCFRGNYSCDRKTSYKTFDNGEQAIEIKCKSYYFSGRDCIYFYSNNRITFASWSDSVNLKPIYKAFIEWCDWMHEKKEVAHVQVI